MSTIRNVITSFILITLLTGCTEKKFTVQDLKNVLPYTSYKTVTSIPELIFLQKKYQNTGYRRITWLVIFWRINAHLWLSQTKVQNSWNIFLQTNNSKRLRLTMQNSKRMKIPWHPHTITVYTKCGLFTIIQKNPAFRFICKNYRKL